jgi:hypothetical protein
MNKVELYLNPLEHTILERALYELKNKVKAQSDIYGIIPDINNLIKQLHNNKAVK